MRKLGSKIENIKVFMTADLHLFHANMLKWDNMPRRKIFENTHEMHKTIISNWNSVIDDDDIVYLLGDVCMKNGRMARNIIEQLNGRKRLIIGNHDKYKEVKKFEDLFEFVDNYESINYLYKEKYHQIVMSHYPFQSWDRKHYGSIMCHGHVHSKEQNPKNRILDVGIDSDFANFYPILLDDIIKYMENITFNK